jgi:hypothetical protein
MGEVFGVYVGATPSRKEPSYWDGSIPWVSSGEVAFCRILDTAENITEEGLARTSTRLHPEGTVLLGMIGEGKLEARQRFLILKRATIRTAQLSAFPRLCILRNMSIGISTACMNGHEPQVMVVIINQLSTKKRYSGSQSH